MHHFLHGGAQVKGVEIRKLKILCDFFFHMIFILVILTNGEGLRFFLAHF